MASPIVESWIYATMLIENEWGQRGSGFLVVRVIDDASGRIFLVTNKHVLHKEAEMRSSATRVVLYFNVKNADGSITGQTTEFPLNYDDGSKRWHEHPDQDVDVLAIDVTPLLVQYPQIEKRWADYSHFADRSKLDELDVTMGDEIVVIGYPLGLRQGATNFPLLRGGIIATRIGEILEDDYRESDGTLRKRMLRGFLIDGATIPGSSGSPVVLKPTTGRFVKGKIVMGFSPPVLLGIVAETRYAPVQTPAGDIPSFAGLGLVFDAETVRETIELLFE
jgi:hypothetical protein